MWVFLFLLLFIPAPEKTEQNYTCAPGPPTNQSRALTSFEITLYPSCQPHHCQPGHAAVGNNQRSELVQGVPCWDWKAVGFLVGLVWVTVPLALSSPQKGVTYYNSSSFILNFLRLWSIWQKKCTWETLQTDFFVYLPEPVDSGPRIYSVGAPGKVMRVRGKFCCLSESVPISIPPVC